MSQIIDLPFLDEEIELGDEFDNFTDEQIMAELRRVLPDVFPEPEPPRASTIETGLAGGEIGALVMAEGIFRTPETAARIGGAVVGAIPGEVGEFMRGPLGPFGNPIAVEIGESLAQAGTFVAEKIGNAREILTGEVLRDTGLGQAGFYEIGQAGKLARDSLKAALENRNPRDLLPLLTDTRAWAAFIGQAVPSLAAAYLSGGSLPFIAWLEGMESASSAADFEERTGTRISDVEFTQAVAQAALINALLERTGLRGILRASKRAPPGARGNLLRRAANSIVGRIARGTGGESITEGLQAFNTNLAEFVTFNPETNLLEGVVPSMMGGLGAGGVSTTAVVAAERLAPKAPPTAPPPRAPPRRPAARERVEPTIEPEVTPRAPERPAPAETPAQRARRLERELGRPPRGRVEPPEGLADRYPFTDNLGRFFRELVSGELVDDATEFIEAGRVFPKAQATPLKPADVARRVFEEAQQPPPAEPPPPPAVPPAAVIPDTVTMTIASVIPRHGRPGEIEAARKVGIARIVLQGDQSVEVVQRLFPGAKVRKLKEGPAQPGDSRFSVEVGTEEGMARIRELTGREFMLLSDDEPVVVKVPEAVLGATPDQAVIVERQRKRKILLQPRDDDDFLTFAVLQPNERGVIGIDQAEAEAQGIDPANFRRRVRGLQLAFVKNGKTFDEIAEQGREAGFQGLEGPNEVLDFLDRATRGEKILRDEGIDQQIDRLEKEERDFREQVAQVEPELSEDFGQQILNLHDAAIRLGLEAEADAILNTSAPDSSVLFKLAELVDRGTKDTSTEEAADRAVDEALSEIPGEVERPTFELERPGAEPARPAGAPAPTQAQLIPQTEAQRDQQLIRDEVERRQAAADKRRELGDRAALLPVEEGGRQALVPTGRDVDRRVKELEAQRDAIIAKYSETGNLIAARTKMTREDRVREAEISTELGKILAKGDSPRMQATGILSGSRVDALERAGYEIVWADETEPLTKNERIEAAGPAGGGAIDQLAEAGISVIPPSRAKVPTAKAIKEHQRDLRVALDIAEAISKKRKGRGVAKSKVFQQEVINARAAANALRRAGEVLPGRTASQMEALGFTLVEGERGREFVEPGGIEAFLERQAPGAKPPTAREIGKKLVEDQREFDRERDQLRGELEPTAPTPAEPPLRTLSDAQILVNKKVADKLRESASKLDTQIEAKLRPAIGEQALTPRRARITAGIQEEGRRLQEVQQVMNGIADGLEAGSIVAVDPLGKIRNRAQVEALLNPARSQFEEGQERGKFERKLKSTNEEDIKRLAKLGITSEAEFLRSKEAIFALVKGEPPVQAVDRQIDEKTRELIANRIPGFFQTPTVLADRMVKVADIHPGMVVLDPSAGIGAIAEAIRNTHGDTITLEVGEVQSSLREILELKGFNLTSSDFLEIPIPPGGLADRIIMNPPFERGMDIDHVLHAFALLKPGGKLVSLVSEGPFFRKDIKSTNFREFLDEQGTEGEKLPTATFAEAGALRRTGVNARLVVVNKAGPGVAAPERLEIGQEFGSWATSAGFISDDDFDAGLTAVSEELPDSFTGVARRLVPTDEARLSGLTEIPPTRVWEQIRRAVFDVSELNPNQVASGVGLPVSWITDIGFMGWADSAPGGRTGDAAFWPAAMVVSWRQRVLNDIAELSERAGRPGGVTMDILKVLRMHVAHEITHSVDFASRGDGRLFYPASANSPFFSINPEFVQVFEVAKKVMVDARPGGLGPVLQEILDVYLSDERGIGQFLSYPMSNFAAEVELWKSGQEFLGDAIDDKAEAQPITTSFERIEAQLTDMAEEARIVGSLAAAIEIDKVRQALAFVRVRISQTPAMNHQVIVAQALKRWLDFSKLSEVGDITEGMRLNASLLLKRSSISRTAVNIWDHADVRVWRGQDRIAEANKGLAFIKYEAFAQLGALYHTHTALVRELMPRSAKLMEDIVNDTRNIATQSGRSTRVREILQANAPDVGVTADPGDPTTAGTGSVEIQGADQVGPRGDRRPPIETGELHTLASTDDKGGEIGAFVEQGEDGHWSYVGIDMEDIGRAPRGARQRAKDRLGVPEEGIDIQGPERLQRPGILSSFLSPSTVVKKFPVFRIFKDLADRAQLVQERLRDRFRVGLRAIETTLGAGVLLRLQPRRLEQYRANSRLYTTIRWTEDMLGHQFTEGELRDRFQANDQVIKAMRQIRNLYDRALGLANRVRDLRGKLPVNRREGYVPHFFHEFFLIADGEIVGSLRTLREAVAMANQITRAVPNALVRIQAKEFQFPGEQMQAAIVSDRSYFKLKAGLEKALELTADEAQELLEGLQRIRGRSRFVGNFLERKGVPGFERNLQWIDRHYFNMMSRFIGLDPFKQRGISLFENRFGGFDKDHKGIAGYIKNYLNDVNGVPTDIEELLNTSFSKVPGLKQWLGSFFGDRPALQIAGMTTNAVAILKLGLYNTSAAFVNASQLLFLDAIIGPTWTTIGVARAAAVKTELGKRRLGFGGKAKRDIGILKQAGVDVQQGLEAGSGYSKAAQMGALFRASTLFFREVEIGLRMSAVLGQYHKARSQGMDHLNAIELAKQTNIRVNFDYSVTDAPDFIRRGGPIGTVLFQFKKFPVKAMEFMVSLRGAEQIRFWIPFFLISGLLGLPGFDLLKNLIRRVTGKDIELEFKEFVLEWARDVPSRLAVAKTVFYGVFSNEKLGGIDVSRRIGAGDFIPSDIDDLFGPSLSTVVRTAQLASRGMWLESLRAISTAPGNLLIAIANDGEVTSPWDRNRLVTRLDTKGRIAKALGARTTLESFETDVSRIFAMEGRKMREQTRDLVDDILAAGTNAKKIDKLLDRAEDLGIPLTPIMFENEILRKNITRGQRAFLNANVRIRATLGGVIAAGETQRVNVERLIARETQ